MANSLFFGLWLLSTWLAGYIDSVHGSIGSIIPESMFNNMLKHRNDAACPGKGFYTYRAFINAANAFPAFGSTGDLTTKKREIAAFLGQTSHETTGGWPTAPDGPYAWGYCFINEKGNPPPTYCQASAQWPCAPNKKYYGRGPIQISWNLNYGPAGRRIGFNGLADPDIVARDATIAFKTALWFWMTPQAPKPSCHDVVTGRWRPSPNDVRAGRMGGYGTITNIINGAIECGKGPNDKVKDRIGFYKRYCDIYKIPYGQHLDCNKERPFGTNLSSCKETEEFGTEVTEELGTEVDEDVQVQDLFMEDSKDDQTLDMPMDASI
ncbi:class I chitinase [Cinnamomum micranthum f. kanehirae]|uniref:Class I chitinase n=1 Tax=Cinnamomum micranthum f. kanehirae TaxID=337451 RepID=A0A443PXM9_9MAGN|nr:class I chitinase [Cinnamomum micranthum f. kanehirae]